MEDHFWINPLHLDIDNVDGYGTAESDEDRKTESRFSRSIDGELTEHDMNAFFESVQVADQQLQDLKRHMLDVQFPKLEPDSIESQEYEFLKVPDVITDINSSLLEIYHYLQRYAAALFHILNEANVEDSYYEKLKEAKDIMVRMLCDIQFALVVSHLTPYVDITYDMLPEIIRNKRSTFQSALRDFIIIRDYAKFLQYVLSKKEAVAIES